MAMQILKVVGKCLQCEKQQWSNLYLYTIYISTSFQSPKMQCLLIIEKLGKCNKRAKINLAINQLLRKLNISLLYVPVITLLSMYPCEMILKSTQLKCTFRLTLTYKYSIQIKIHSHLQHPSRLLFDHF